jgi:hypothetical protein
MISAPSFQDHFIFMGIWFFLKQNGVVVNFS